MAVSKTYKFEITITVDDEDADVLENLDRRYAKGTLTNRVVSNFIHNVSVDGYIGLHRGILARMGQTYGKGYNADHIDRNSGNNTRANLRVVTISENIRNRSNSLKEQSQYSGVVWSKARKKWTTMVKEYSNGKIINHFAGCHINEIDAAKAVDAKIIELGLDKPLNFSNEQQNSQIKDKTEYAERNPTTTRNRVGRPKKQSQDQIQRSAGQAT